MQSENFQAAVLRRFYERDVLDPGYEIVQKLPDSLRELVYLVLSVGSDRKQREVRLRQELAARGFLDVLGQLDKVDLTVGLEQLAGADDWRFLGLGEAYEPLPPIDWVVQPLISRPSISIVYGAPKNLKSLLLADLAVCAASGFKWLADRSDKDGFETWPTITTWLDFENGERRMRERFGALGRSRNLPADTLLSWVSTPTPWLNASRSGDMEALAGRLEQRGTGLLFVDHLTQVVGDVDENTSAISEIMGGFRRLAEQLRLAIVLVHHTVKSAGRFGVSAADSLRGHGSLLASSDFAAVVERQVMDRNAVVFKPVAVRGAPVDDFGAVFAFEWKGDGSRELESARFFGQTVEGMDSRLEEAILNVVRESPGINQTALRSETGYTVVDAGDLTIRKVISRLERNGALKVRAGKRQAKLYFLAASDDDD